MGESYKRITTIWDKINYYENTFSSTIHFIHIITYVAIEGGGEGGVLFRRA